MFLSWRLAPRPIRPGYFLLHVPSTTGETIGELLDDGGGQRIRDHPHVSGSAANRHETLVRVAARLSIDHVFQSQHVTFHEIGNRLFWQIRIRLGESRAGRPSSEKHMLAKQSVEA